MLCSHTPCSLLAWGPAYWHLLIHPTQFSINPTSRNIIWVPKQHAQHPTYKRVLGAAARNHLECPPVYSPAAPSQGAGPVDLQPDIAGIPPFQHSTSNFPFTQTGSMGSMGQHHCHHPAACHPRPCWELVDSISILPKPRSPPKAEAFSSPKFLDCLNSWEHIAWDFP